MARMCERKDAQGAGQWCCAARAVNGANKARQRLILGSRIAIKNGPELGLKRDTGRVTSKGERALNQAHRILLWSGGHYRGI
jgi:hypothetical protein